MKFRTRPYATTDTPAILRLNAESEHLLSPLDEERFDRLRKNCSLLRVVELEGDLAGFVLGFCDGVDYDSVNYQWFSSRLKNFFYIDRVVVTKSARSAGIGRSLYQEIHDWARARELVWLAAEIDLVPPNSASLKFHDQQGFIRIGQQSAGATDKLVSLQVCSVAGAPPQQLPGMGLPGNQPA